MRSLRMRFAALIAATACSAVAVAAPPECPPSSARVDKVRLVAARERVRLTGVVYNDCATPIGVQLKFTLYDRDGAVIVSEEFWPASVRNIPARGDYAIEYLTGALRAEPTRYDLRVIDTRAWQ